MIIKKANIIAFGGIKNKEINFSNGFNIIYGENEAGKSTVQAFIKIWLYGFLSYKGKDYKINERLKYTPLNGDNISGELYVEFENKQYIIKRTFGKSKKEDTSTIIDAITGENVDYISNEEPGKFFFNINRTTFVNTVFISQLGVGVKQDKEEELLNKISTSIGAEDGQVSINTAFLKLDNYKKSISNIRKSGRLDVLNKKYSELIEEKYEGYKLSEHNLDNEEKLINLNQEKINLNNELINLDIYKKYIKKIKLQKEFEDITEYFRKKEELENKEKSINESLVYNNEILNYRFIKDIKEENSMYLSLLELRNKEYEEFKCKEAEINSFKEPLKKYTYIDSFPEDILNVLEKLKIKSEVLKEKVDINETIRNEIEFLKTKDKDSKKTIGEAYNIKEYRDDIEKLVNNYEEKLKELKSLIEDGKDNNTINMTFTYIALSICIGVSIVSGIFIKSMRISIVLYIIALILICSMVVLFYINKNGRGYDRKIDIAKEYIRRIEDELDLYVQKLNVNDYR